MSPCSADRRQPFACTYLVAASILTTWLLIGCGGSGRVAVEGSIRSSTGFVPNGTVRFLPAADNDAPVALTAIEEGRYRFSNSDGPFAGNYTVVVNLELDYAQMSALGSSGDEPPTLKWETRTFVPQLDRFVLDIVWPAQVSKADSSEEAETSS